MVNESGEALISEVAAWASRDRAPGDRLLVRREQAIAEQKELAETPQRMAEKAGIVTPDALARSPRTVEKTATPSGIGRLRSIVKRIGF